MPGTRRAATGSQVELVEIQRDFDQFIAVTAKELILKFGSLNQDRKFWAEQAKHVCKWSSWLFSGVKKQQAIKLLGDTNITVWLARPAHLVSDDYLISMMSEKVANECIRLAQIKPHHYQLRWKDTGLPVKMDEIDPLSDGNTIAFYQTKEAVEESVFQLKKWYASVGVSMPEVTIEAYDKDRRLIQ